MYLPIDAFSGEKPTKIKTKREELEEKVADLKRRLDFLEDIVRAIEMRT